MFKGENEISSYYYNLYENEINNENINILKRYV